jgi:hypothetical protein
MLTTVRFGRRLPTRVRLGQDAAETLRRTGPIVDVEIAVPPSYAAAIRQQGQEPPAPQVVRGLLDTGASISTVTDEVAAAAGLQQTGTVQLGGVGGTGTRPIYTALFRLTQYGIGLDVIEVASVPIAFGGGEFQILIGRDVLRRLRFDYHGSAGTFALTTNGLATPPAKGIPTEFIVGGAVVAAGAALLLLLG